MSEFTHINEERQSNILDVSETADNLREAVAKGSIYMKRDTLNAVAEGKLYKGDVLSVAQVGGIMGAKSTADIIPMCNNINIFAVDIEFKLDYESCKIDAIATVKTTGAAGAEMQAMTAVSVATLIIYDMCKAVDKEMVITDIFVVKKTEENMDKIYSKRVKNPTHKCGGDIKMEKGDMC